MQISEDSLVFKVRQQYFVGKSRAGSDRFTPSLHALKSKSLAQLAMFKLTPIIWAFFFSTWITSLIICLSLPRELARIGMSEVGILYGYSVGVGVVGLLWLNWRAFFEHFSKLLIILNTGLGCYLRFGTHPVVDFFVVAPQAQLEAYFLMMLSPFLLGIPLTTLLYFFSEKWATAWTGDHHTFLSRMRLLLGMITLTYSALVTGVIMYVLQFYTVELDWFVSTFAVYIIFVPHLLLGFFPSSKRLSHPLAIFWMYKK